MAKGLGHIQLPSDMLSIVKTKSEFDKDKKKPEKPKEMKFSNDESYLLEFDRLIDPVLICMFYGLYKSKELPPFEDEPIPLDERYEFAANISEYKNIFNHLLFCIWVKENGFPDPSDTSLDYRKKLYEFIGRILVDEYFTKVVIPFYLKKADEEDGGRSFIARMRDSGYREYKIDTSSPEYLALDFFNKQKEFQEEFMEPLEEKLGSLK